MIENWKDMQGYEGLYQISDLGRIKSYPRVVKCKESNERIIKSRILKQYHTSNHYLFVRLSKNKKQTNYRVHRLVALNFIDNPENKPCVNHIDGNKSNNRVDNLEWCTHSENMQHAVKNGLSANWNKGKHYHLSEEHKRKISEANKKRFSKDIA